MSFPRPAAATLEDSGGLLVQGLKDAFGFGSQRGNLTGTIPCALNSALRGDHGPAVGLAPGASWDITLTLPLSLTRNLHRNLSLPRSLTLQLS